MLEECLLQPTCTTMSNSQFHFILFLFYRAWRGGLKLTNHEIMTWAEIKSQTLNQLSHPGIPISFYLKQIFLNTYSLLRDREHEQGRGRERETDRQTESEAVSRLWAVREAWRRARTHEPQDHHLSQRQTPNWLSHPGTPVSFYF